MIKGMVRKPVEIKFASRYRYDDPFNEIEMDVTFADADGHSWKVPAFWAGEREWRVRFSAPHTGPYSYTTSATAADPGLDQLHGEIEIGEYTGDNKLYRHGPIRVMDGGRYFQHEDGTPFFWLGDTWWMVFSKRMRYPDDIRLLTQDRVQKGFTVIQLLNGLWCDVEPFDRRGENEAGYCWTENWGSINPEYYNLADLKLDMIVESGLVPCMAGAWGFYMGFMGLEKMKKHYRYMVARYGAYPVIWNLAGEGWMKYYCDTQDVDLIPELENRPVPELHGATTWSRRHNWSEMLAYLKSIDPYHRIITAHETYFCTSLDNLDNPELLDFLMWQGTHADQRDEIYDAVTSLTRRCYESTPARPTVNSECAYEGIQQGCGPEVQRFVFWHSFLNGCAGWTYGAQGIWAASSLYDTFGPSPHGGDWGSQPWQYAYQAPGSRQVGACAGFMQKLPWWRLIPAPERIQNIPNCEKFRRSVAAEIPGECIVVYNPQPVVPHRLHKNSDPFSRNEVRPALRGLEPGSRYHVTLYNPIDDVEIDQGICSILPDGAFPLVPPSFQDWVFVLKKEN